MMMEISYLGYEADWHSEARRPAQISAAPMFSADRARTAFLYRLSRIRGRRVLETGRYTAGIVYRPVNRGNWQYRLGPYA
jgi:hypothetical protein